MYRHTDGRYRERITLPNGKVKEFKGRTKKEVIDKIAAWNGKQAKSETFTSVAEDWLESKLNRVTPKTIEGYQAPLKRLISALGDKSIQDIQPADIQGFINNLAQMRYARYTVQRHLDITRMIFDYAITLPGSTVRYNPCSSVKIPKGLVQETRDLMAREHLEIIKSHTDAPFALFPLMMLYTGMRDGEALAITDKDITDNVISITKSVTWQHNRPVIKEPKTAAGVRATLILQPLMDILPKFKGYLFSADNGKSPLSQTQFRHRWRGYLKAVGLLDENGKPLIVPYQLRHEYASMCYEANLPVKVTQKIMGHASQDTTTRVYTHIQDQQKLKGLIALEEYLKGTDRGQDADKAL